MGHEAFLAAPFGERVVLLRQLEAVCSAGVPPAKRPSENYFTKIAPDFCLPSRRCGGSIPRVVCDRRSNEEGRQKDKQGW